MEKQSKEQKEHDLGEENLDWWLMSSNGSWEVRPREAEEEKEKEGKEEEEEEKEGKMRGALKQKSSAYSVSVSPLG